MVDIASQSGEVTSGLVYDIHRIATSILRIIEEEHHMCSLDESSTSYGPSMKLPISST